MKNCIGIKLGTKEVKLILNANASHEDIVECLHKKLQKLKELYKGDKTPVFVTGKSLKAVEEEEIEMIIVKELKVDVTFDGPKELGLHEIKKAFTQEIASSDTKFHKGSLRSGQKIEYEGSIVIIGDVNGASEVIAGDHIIILGKLRGMAHAGAKGNTKGIIAAESFETPQVRISNVIREIEKSEYEDREIPIKYAYVEEDKIILE